MKAFDLTGKKILITGASSGIGRQTAISVSGAGGQLFITGQNEGRLNDTLLSLEGSGHVAIPANLTDEKQLNLLVDSLVELNGVVHCAGLTAHMPAQFIRAKNISTLFDVNFNVPLLLTARLLKKKKFQKSASIVFLSSIASKYPFFAGSIYSSTKAAIEAYSRTLAVELAPKKIRSNCILPAMVKTEMVEETEKTISKEALDKMERMYPLGFGEPVDVANAVIFFLSDASKWITGANLALGGIQ